MLLAPRHEGPPDPLGLGRDQGSVQRLVGPAVLTQPVGGEGGEHPHLHHRPQPHLQVTPSSAPAGTGVDGARQRRHTDRPMHSALVDSVLAKVQRLASLLEARWSVSTVCHANLEPLAFGALQQAGR